MAIVLGTNQYGKAENRVVRIYRDTARHEIRDLNVTTALRGDFAAAHVDGDQAGVLPTDTQKNTAFAYAKKHGVTSPEDYATALGRRLLAATPAATGSRVGVEEYAWDRIQVAGRGHDHAFVRRGGEVRTAVVDVTADGIDVESGLTDLVVLKSTGSEFKGFLRDEYTTLPEADDRILATSLTARWRHDPDRTAGLDWDAAYAAVRALLLETFATTYSRALQETLYAMGVRRPRGPAGGHRDRLHGTQQAPPPRRPLPVRPPERRRGLPRRRPAVRPDRGHRPPGGLVSDLTAFNAMPAAELRARLEGCLDVPRWVDTVVAGRPYADLDALLAVAGAAAELDDDELAAALARHPRIGERAGAGHDAALSAREQSGVDRSDAGVAERLAAGNRAYEERFDRVFLIRAAGRDAPEILARARAAARQRRRH